MKNTLCSKCHFANTIDNEQPCFFNIPDIVKSIHKVDIENNFYKINNYQCTYGLNKTTYQENIDKFHNLDLVEYIKQQNVIKYTLCIIYKSGNIQGLIDNINALTISPSFIFLVCYNQDILKISEALSKKEPYIKYKIHNILDNTFSDARSLHVSLDTNKNKVNHILWILNEDGLKLCIEKDSIQYLNYLVNVEQKPAHYYKHKELNSQFNGIFITADNYWLFSKNETYYIKDTEEALVVEYD